jgi:hypothetical protein
LSDCDIDRVFDERLVPEALVRAQDGRRFARFVSALARFHVVTDGVYVATVRRRVMTELTERVLARLNPDRVLALQEALSRGTVAVQGTVWAGRRRLLVR